MPRQAIVSATGNAAAPARGHWSRIACQWDQVGPPLRPSAQDISVYAREMTRWAAAHGAPQGLILGVTPELYHLPWPDGSRVCCIDRTQKMIDEVWPGPAADATCADWTDMPLAAGSKHVALCDGGIIMVAYPHGHARLVRAMHRVLADDGLCIMRLYVRPPRRERVQTVLGELLQGRIANLNILKLRLGMALQETSADGVELARVWETLHRAAPDFPTLADRIGWPLEHLLAINTYRDCPSRYSFLSLAEVHGLFTERPGGFNLISIDVPTYPLGERCPIVAFRRRAA